MVFSHRSGHAYGLTTATTRRFHERGPPRGSVPVCSATKRAFLPGGSVRCGSLAGRVSHGRHFGTAEPTNLAASPRNGGGGGRVFFVNRFTGLVYAAKKPSAPTHVPRIARLAVLETDSEPFSPLVFSDDLPTRSSLPRSLLLLGAASSRHI